MDYAKFVIVLNAINSKPIYAISSFWRVGFLAFINVFWCTIENWLSI